MFQTNKTCEALRECYLMSNISKRNLASGCHLLKKIDQTSWRTTRRNYKHIPQIVCISSRFQVLHLLSWEFEQPEVLWRHRSADFNMFQMTYKYNSVSSETFRTKDFSHKSFSTSFGPFAQFLVVISHNNYKWETLV